MQELPQTLTVSGLKHCRGEVTLPGSKSIANRALLIAALADKPVVLKNLLRSDDTARMLEALNALGVEVEEVTPTQVVVHGCSGQWTTVPERLLLGNAGTAMRPLVAVLAATLTGKQSVTLDGDPRMRERPLGDLIDSLVERGAALDCLQNQGYPPLAVSSGLQAGDFTIDGSVSSQYVSALLMALPLLAEDSTLTLTGDVVSRPYIELTIAMLGSFGITIKPTSERQYAITGGQQYRSPGEYFIEGDASGASYWMAAAAIAGGPITIQGVGQHSIQGDIGFADVVQRMGATVEWGENSVTVSGSGALQPIDFDGNQIPDAAMTIVPLALFAKGRTSIRNVANWRVKETDRLAAMATEARKFGATVEEGADYLIIDPPAVLKQATVDTYDDHRIAMCFALLGFSANGVNVNDPGCCKKTYPQFFNELSRLCHIDLLP